MMLTVVKIVIDASNHMEESRLIKNGGKNGDEVDLIEIKFREEH